MTEMMMKDLKKMNELLPSLDKGNVKNSRIVVDKLKQIHFNGE